MFERNRTKQNKLALMPSNKKTDLLPKTINTSPIFVHDSLFVGRKKKDRKLSMSIGSRKISMEALKITIIFIFLIMLV